MLICVGLKAYAICRGCKTSLTSPRAWSSAITSALAIAQLTTKDGKERREAARLDTRGMQERKPKPRELTKRKHCRALPMTRGNVQTTVRMSSPLEGERDGPTCGQTSGTGVPAPSSI